eukprot:351090_1
MLTNIATYTESNDKLSGIAFTCSGELYGLTGGQSDHSLYLIDHGFDGAFTYITDLDASSKGNGIAYNPFDDYMYRVSGTDQLDIEQIDYETGNITSNYYIDPDDIIKVRSIGHYKEDFLFIIDEYEQLFELDIESGDVSHLHNLTNTRKHKGIVCTDWVDICNPTTTSSPFPIVSETTKDGGSPESP